MLSSVCWVSRGAPQSVPTWEGQEVDDVLPEEQREIEPEGQEIEGTEHVERVSTEEVHGEMDMEDEETRKVMKEFHMDSYEDEDADHAVFEEQVFGGAPGSSLYYKTNEEDPNLQAGEGGEDDDSEIEDIVYRPTDLVLVAARSGIEDVSTLETYVFEPQEESLYVHHDTLLPTYPLCLEWMDAFPGDMTKSGNVAAVGSFLPGIEIWNLDVMDAQSPVAILGGTLAQRGGEVTSSASEVRSEPKGKGRRRKRRGAKGKKKMDALSEGSHADAVLGLSWNRLNRQALASCSSDGTVKLWDLQTCQCADTFTHHKNKVQSVVWHPQEGNVLLSASFDGTVALLDVQSVKSTHSWLTFSVGGEVECLAWDYANPNRFFASNDTGEIMMFDVRNPSSPVFRLGAHNDACTGLATSPYLPGLLATGSTDEVTKIWSFRGDRPSLATSRDLSIGGIFHLSFSTDAEFPFLLAVCGVKGSLQLWDVRDTGVIAETFNQEKRTPLQLTVGDDRMEDEDSD